MYSLDWSRKVVAEHYKSHARASYILLSTGPIDTGILAKWLSKNDERWTLWKKAVLAVEDLMIPEEGLNKYLTSVGQKTLSGSDTIYKIFARTPLEPVFTRLGFNLRLEKQSLKARASASGDQPDEMDAQATFNFL